MPDHPHCPKCDARLVLTQVTAVNVNVGIHHLECPRCDYVLDIPRLETARPSNGWVIQRKSGPLRSLGIEAVGLNPSPSWSDSMSIPPASKHK
jgi:hypothetical protein